MTRVCSYCVQVLPPDANGEFCSIGCQMLCDCTNNARILPRFCPSLVTLEHNKAIETARQRPFKSRKRACSRYRAYLARTGYKGQTLEVPDTVYSKFLRGLI